MGVYFTIRKYSCARCRFMIQLWVQGLEDNMLMKDGRLFHKHRLAVRGDAFPPKGPHVRSPTGTRNSIQILQSKSHASRPSANWKVRGAQRHEEIHTTLESKSRFRSLQEIPALLTLRPTATGQSLSLGSLPFVIERTQQDLQGSLFFVISRTQSDLRGAFLSSLREFHRNFGGGLPFVIRRTQ